MPDRGDGQTDGRTDKHISTAVPRLEAASDSNTYTRNNESTLTL